MRVQLPVVVRALLSLLLVAAVAVAVTSGVAVEEKDETVPGTTYQNFANARIRNTYQRVGSTAAAAAAARRAQSEDNSGLSEVTLKNVNSVHEVTRTASIPPVRPNNFPSTVPSDKEIESYLSADAEDEAEESTAAKKNTVAASSVKASPAAHSASDGASMAKMTLQPQQPTISQELPMPPLVPGMTEKKLTLEQEYERLGIDLKKSSLFCIEGREVRMSDRIPQAAWTSKVWCEHNDGICCMNRQHCCPRHLKCTWDNRCLDPNENGDFEDIDMKKSSLFCIKGQPVRWPMTTPHPDAANHKIWCSHNDGVCCPNQLHCCPGGWTCNGDQCVKGGQIASQASVAQAVSQPHAAADTSSEAAAKKKAEQEQKAKQEQEHKVKAEQEQKVKAESKTKSEEQAKKSVAEEQAKKGEQEQKQKRGDEQKEKEQKQKEQEQKDKKLAEQKQKEEQQKEQQQKEQAQKEEKTKEEKQKEEQKKLEEKQKEQQQKEAKQKEQLQKQQKPKPEGRLGGNKNWKPAQGKKLAAAADVGKHGQFSYLMWLKPVNTAERWMAVFQKGLDRQSRCPAMWFIPGTTQLHVRSATSLGWNTGVNTEAIPLNQWTHVAITHQEGALKVLFNGELNTDINTGKETVKRGRALPKPDENDGDLWASAPWYEPADVWVADYRVFPRALTDAEVQEIVKQKLYDQPLDD